jgi:hypothetical protein
MSSWRDAQLKHRDSFTFYQSLMQQAFQSNSGDAHKKMEATTFSSCGD